MSKLKEGYKQTKVGVIPEEWEFKRLGNLLEYEQPTKYLVANKDYDDSYKTPVLTAGKTFILGYTKEENGIFKENLPVIIFDDFTTATKFVDFPFKVKSSAMKILKSKNKKINIKLVFEMMQMINYEADDHKRYWISEFQDIEIKLPPYEEQQKIAKILTTWDDAISKQEELIKAKEQLKKGLMQKLLSGEVRFAGFDEEWEEVKLGEISKFQQGLQVDLDKQSLVKYEDYIRFIRIVDYTQVNEIPRYILYEKKDENKFVKKDEIVMIRYGNIGYIGRNIEGVIANNMFKINFDTNINLDYIFYVLNTEKIQYFLQSNNTSSTMPALSFGIVKSLKIKLPPIEEQQKIAQILTIADKEIELLKNELEVLKEQKKGLMQKLLTGEVRVKIDEEV